MSALRVDVDGGVWVVTIDHPPTNLVDGGLIGGLLQLLDEAVEARVLVFRSADPDFFLMHGDVEGILASTPSDDAPNVAAATFDRLRRWVTIAFIDGAARGGGCEFLSALDFRIGTARTVVGQPEVPMGILPGAGGTARWPRLVGRSHALDILLTGRDVGAEELLALGWLHSLGTEADAMALAHRIAAMSPESVAAVKEVVDIAGFGDALAAESRALTRLLRTGSHRAPMQRFLDLGGQTREAESTRMASLVDGMLHP